MKILLIEPNYKNKYPPLGLMKLSSYHKNKGDYVVFHKGIDDFGPDWDRIYITTLFTFHFDIVVKTINHYINMLGHKENIYVGGILASLMPDKLKLACDIDNVLTGVLSNSSIIGFEDNVNIDQLPLDYDILTNTEYLYPAGDNYFSYTTRGCTNACAFCAVPTLEPVFMQTNNLVDQINHIKKTFGDKKNLLLLDNNILSLTPAELKIVVADIQSLGFTHEPSYVKPLEFDLLLDTVERFKLNGINPNTIIDKLYFYLREQKNKRMSQKNKLIYHEIIEKLDCEANVYKIIKIYENELRDILNTSRIKKKVRRFVDFNQGIDARLLTEEKMEILAQIPIKPFRLAYDHMGTTDKYVEALRRAHSYGVKEFSNYLLYNFQDRPEELWKRLEINISLAEELDTHIFSFPMRYSPISITDRKFIGKHWNKQYISNIQAIMNVTKGIVARNREFFFKAYGRNIDEFFKILLMPRDFVTYRKYFEQEGLTNIWSSYYESMTQAEKDELLEILCDERSSDTTNSNIIKKILPYYQINYIHYSKTKDTEVAI